MKRLTNLLAITLLTSCATAFAQEQEETTTGKSAVEQSADIYASGYNKFRFGGYGEILANFMDYGINRFRGTDNGSKKDHRNSISIPRFVLAFDYKFNSQWILGAEIEFEAGGTGSAYEIENTENGEYEMEVEKGGEVACPSGLQCPRRPSDRPGRLDQRAARADQLLRDFPSGRRNDSPSFHLA